MNTLVSALSIHLMNETRLMSARGAAYVKRNDISTATLLYSALFHQNGSTNKYMKAEITTIKIINLLTQYDILLPADLFADKGAIYYSNNTEATTVSHLLLVTTPGECDYTKIQLSELTIQRTVHQPCSVFISRDAH